MNIKAFMKQELKDRGTMEFDGLPQFTDDDGKPVPIIVKRLSAAELRDIRDLYRTKKVYRDKRNGGRPVVDNGRIAMIQDYDSEKAGNDIICTALVQPKLDDPELMEFYGVLDRLDMPRVIFPDAESWRYVNHCVTVACGLDTDEDDEIPNEEKATVSEVKN